MEHDNPHSNAAEVSCGVPLFNKGECPTNDDYWLDPDPNEFDLDLVKEAALKPDVQLQPHQQRIFDQSSNHPIRKLLMWQLGSGKSLGAIGAAEAGKSPYTMIGPASLRPTLTNEYQRFTDQRNPAS